MQGNRPLVLALTLLALAGVFYVLKTADDSSLGHPAAPVRVVTVGGYPEFHVDRRPFFMHSAAFYYYRTPRDRWEETLRAYRDSGINTIDLYVIWNWHEPAEGALDFDGRTSPRRDLRGLLEIADRLGLKLSVRPGPFICSEWRNGGYPDWLLRKPEYSGEHRMPLRDVLEGRYPRLSALQYVRSEEAAEAYLANPVHLRYTRKWYQDVMDVVRPYLASRGRNVILLQVDDDQGLDPENYNGPKFWQYLDLLRSYLRDAARDRTTPVYFNPADMRVTAQSAVPPWGPAFWAMGQYYQEEGYGSDVFRAEDSSRAKYLTEILKTQPGFPPFFIEYQAGWFAGADDVRARATDPTNTLLSSRFLFGNGAKGLNYFPTQDTLYPEGYECPWSNYFYSWESALGYEGDFRERAAALLRNGRLIRGLGPLLAASHYVSDVAIAHTMSSYPQRDLTPEDVARVLFRTKTALEFAQINQISAELVDLEYAALEQLERYRLILLPVLSNAEHKPYLRLSARARGLLRSYVEKGGVLAAYPMAPREQGLAELFAGAGHGESKTLNAGIEGPITAGAARGRSRKVGAGYTIVLDSQFDRWVPLASAAGPLDGPIRAEHVPPGALERSTSEIANALLRAARISRIVESSDLVRGITAQQPRLSLLAPDDPAKRWAFLSIVNFAENSVDFQPVVHTPPAKLPVVRIAARDALLLPLGLSLGEKLLGLGADFRPTDEILYATAELTAVRAAAGALELDLYSRGEAVVALRLAERIGPPTIGSEQIRYRASDPDLYVIDVPPPRNPNGNQTLRIPYRTVRAAPTDHPPPPARRVGITPSIRIPVRHDTAYSLDPPTLVARAGESIGFTFVHPAECRGQCKASVTVPDLTVSPVDAEASPAFRISAPYERSYIREFQWTLSSAERTYSGTGRVIFLPAVSALAYDSDVDRDGFSDFVMENENVRLILYPHAGARSFAFMRKDTGASAFTSIGGLRDMFRVLLPDPPGQDLLPEWTRRGVPGMFNRAYQGTITREAGPFAEVALHYDAPDVAPSGARLERSVRLASGTDYADVTYTITPHGPAAGQAYVNFNSVAIGSMEDRRATVLRSDKGGEIALDKQGTGTIEGCTWVALEARDSSAMVGMSWLRGTFERVAYRRQAYSLELRLESPVWRVEEKTHTYRVRYLHAPATARARESLADGAR
jgi:hypothetical protein